MLTLNVEAIDRLLQHRKLTRWELAEMAGLHRNTIYSLMAGETSPTLQTVDKIAKALGVSPFSILADVPGIRPEASDRE